MRKTPAGKFYICAIPATLVFYADEIIKHLAESGKWKIPKAGDPEDTLEGKSVLRFRLLHNKGAARGFLKKYPDLVKWISLGLSGVLAAMMAALLIGTSSLPGDENGGKSERGNRLLLTGLSFMLGGALSNTKDRVRRGFVVDYFSFRKGPKALKELVFNLSDMGILLGSILTIFSTFCKRSESGNMQPDLQFDMQTGDHRIS